MKYFLFILFLNPLCLFGQSDSTLFADLDKCRFELGDVSEYPWFNTIEVFPKRNQVKIFLLFYKIDTVLYEYQTLIVSYDNYEEEIRKVEIEKKYFNPDAVVTIVDLMIKNGLSKIEFNGIGDCIMECVKFTKGKDGYILSYYRCERVCDYKPRKKGDRQINKNLLYIKNLKRYFKK